jgi:hypothetical protein
LLDQLREMTARLSRVEAQCVGTDGQASAMRLEAAALRRDIYEAQKHINRLRRRYLDGSALTPSANGHRPSRSS